MHSNIAFAHIESILPFIYVCFNSLFLGINIGAFIAGKLISNKIEINENSSEIVCYIVRIIGTIMCVCLTGIFISAIFLIYGNLVKFVDPMFEAIVYTRASIFVFIVINLSYMFYLYKKGLKAKKVSDFIEMRENFVIILRYFVPLNFIFALLSMFLGINMGLIQW